MTLGASTGLRFAEGQNALDLTLEPPLATYGTLYAMQGSGGSGNGVRYFAVNPAAILANGPFTVQSNLADIASFSALQSAGLAQVNNGLANRTAKTLKIDDSTTAGLWREGDTIIVHYPSMGVVELVCKIVGYEAESGTPKKTLHLDQYPIKHLKAHVARVNQELRQAIAGGSRAAITSPDGLTGIDLVGQGAMLLRDSKGAVRGRLGLQLDGTFGLRLFDTAGNVVPLLTGTPAAGQTSQTFTA